MVYSAELYVHDWDKQAADALNQFPKFVKLLESYSANYDEKAAKIDLLSTAIRLGEKQMPEVYGLLPPICEQLGSDAPELYYVKDKHPNAATFGITYPCIYVTSGLVNTLPLNLLPSALAHECGHIACKHSLYHSIAAQLAGGIDRSPLVRIPAIGKYLTPTLVKALLFWDRCSELSADRAAALCDGTADKTIDVLLRLNGYGKNVDRKEFLNQALDLKSFVNDSRSNKLLELMLVQDETHPRLATRAYECYEWSQSAQYAGIIDGTFTLRDKEKETAQESAEEVVSADANVEAPSIDCLNTELARVNQELERYTNHADKTDYALSVAGGVLAGLVDSLFVGEFSLEYANQWGNQQAENLVLPLLFIGIAAASGMLGIGSTVKAGLDTKSANRINKNANELVQQSTDHLNAQRLACGNALTQLGAEKLSVLNGTLSAFLDVFTQIKNVDFGETEGLDELHRLHIDEQEFVELRGMANFAGSIAGGAVAGTASGALAAFGAYGAAQALAFASTGTAISALSGAAATNATLAFFGGGSLAAGGLGMAGGTVVLGGLVAGPALLVMGLVAGKAAQKGLEKAYTNRAEAIQIAAQLNTASLQCETIRRRTYMFYNLLARLDSYFMPLIHRMGDIVKIEGDDYSQYSAEFKTVIASCASVAVSIKSVLDTPLLTDDGLLTDASEETATNIEGFLKNMRIPY